MSASVRESRMSRFKTEGGVDDDFAVSSTGEEVEEDLCEDWRGFWFLGIFLGWGFASQVATAPPFEERKRKRDFFMENKNMIFASP